MSKLTITPIGTCRIHTPLRRARTRYPIEIDLRRNYGFVHTSDEALQQLKFLQGEKSFSPEVVPLVFRDASQEQLEAEQWQPSDLHIVEISSSKRISYGPDLVQGNYVQRHFSDFFANRERARTYWNLVKRGHRADLLQYLQQQASYRMLPPEDRRLLSGLSMQQQSFKAIAAEMGEIVERLGHDRVVFVTHVNAQTPDGSLIPTRERLIRWVKMAAGQLDVPVFDPSKLMEEFGQEAALENGGTDLTHYTLPFSDRVYDELHRMHVNARLSAEAAAGGEEQQLGLLAAQLETSLDHGDFLGTARRIHKALDEAPDALPLIELRGVVRARIGDYAGAVADLTRRGDEAMLSREARISLLDALESRGEHNAALRVAQGLLAEEFESAKVYGAAGLAAEGMGSTALAAHYLKQSFRKDRSDLATALRALDLLATSGNAAEASEWRKELLDNIGQASSGAFELAAWALKRSDQELFSAAIERVALSDKEGTIDLAEDVLAAAMPRALATAVKVLPRLGNLSRPLAARRDAVIEQAIAQAGELLDKERAIEAHDLAQALVALDPSPTRQVDGARIAKRAGRLLVLSARQVRATIRAAYTSGDEQKVARFGSEAGEILVADPDTSVLVARALNNLGGGSEALEFLKLVQAANPEHFGVRRWAARLAAHEQDYATALAMYASLKDFDEYASVEAEVERFFAGAERRALKRLRELVGLERYEDALELASSITAHLGPLERTERELKLMYRQLRLQLKDVDEGLGEADDREPLMRMMARIRPDDTRLLRRLAVEVMRQGRFAEAAEIWGQLYLLTPDDEIVDRNRVRCATLAERRSSVLVPEVTDVG